MIKHFELAEERMDVSHSRWLHLGQSIYHHAVPAKLLSGLVFSPKSECEEYHLLSSHNLLLRLP